MTKVWKGCPRVMAAKDNQIKCISCLEIHTPLFEGNLSYCLYHQSLSLLLSASHVGQGVRNSKLYHCLSLPSIYYRRVCCAFTFSYRFIGGFHF